MRHLKASVFDLLGVLTLVGSLIPASGARNQHAWADTLGRRNLTQLPELRGCDHLDQGGALLRIPLEPEGDGPLWRAR